MREIIYRGKRIDNGEWVYGDKAHAGIATVICDESNGWIVTPVIPETVGQYTGLKDKNGKRIFEGDICRIDGLLYKVEFKYAAWRFSVLSNNFHCYPAFCSHCDICEVIGNVFDNPELLKGE